MQIVMIAAEARPYCGGSGGGESLGALPAALAQRGHSVSVFLPLHRSMRDDFVPIAGLPPILVRMHDGNEEGILLRADQRVPGVDVFALGADQYFDRPGLYGEGGTEYADSVRRFGFFCRAALGAIDSLGIEPDVLHGHGWPAALIAVYLRGGMLGRDTATRARDRLRKAAVVLSVDDLRVQGVFPSSDFAAAGVPRAVVSPEGIELRGEVNLLREGLRLADHVITVSPRYARDLLTAEHGAGLQDVFEARGGSITGILNGVDGTLWNPATDPHLVSSYDATDLRGKRRCKADLLVETDLEVGLDAPIAGVLSPVVGKKGLELLPVALPWLVERGLSVVVVGEGDSRLGRTLRDLSGMFPGRIAFHNSADEVLTHKLQAGADLLLVPSEYEAYALEPMVAQVYGTVPIVRPAGGLADTVLDAEAVPDRGTGFWIAAPSAEALVDSVDRALQSFVDVDVWTSLRQRGMRRDFSWHHVAARYTQLYRRLVHPSTVDQPSVRLETGSWHGRVGEDFTASRMRAVAQGVAEQLFEENPSDALVQRGVLVGSDTRLLGPNFAAAIAGVLAWNDVVVAHSPEPTALPAASCAVRAAGLAGAIVVTGEGRTSSWNGVHLLGPSGAPISREAASIVERGSAIWIERSDQPEELRAREAAELGLRWQIDAAAAHREALEAAVDVEAIRDSGLEVACDLRWGTTIGTLDRILTDWGVRSWVSNDTVDPSFGETRPAPTPQSLNEWAGEVGAGHDLGLVIDPSGCRLGIVDDRGRVCASDHVVALLLDYVAESRGTRSRGVGRSVATSSLVDAVAARRGLDVIETPTGFQELGALLTQGEILLGVDADAMAIGDGAPHPDAVLTGLLVVEMIARRRRSLSSQLDELYRNTGPWAAGRRRVELPRGLADETAERLTRAPERLGTLAVCSVGALDGLRLGCDGGSWLLARLDSEEPALVLAAEAATVEAVEELLSAAQATFSPAGFEGLGRRLGGTRNQSLV